MAGPIRLYKEVGFKICRVGRVGAAWERGRQITKIQTSYDYKIPESRSAFCRIVSLTAANTSRICCQLRLQPVNADLALTFEVSVA